MLLGNNMLQCHVGKIKGRLDQNHFMVKILRKRKRSCRCVVSGANASGSQDEKATNSCFVS